MVMPLSISSFTKVTRSISRASSRACSKEPAWKEKEKTAVKEQSQEAEPQSCQKRFAPADLPVLSRHQDVFLGDVGSVPGQSHAQLLCRTGSGAC